MKKINPLKYLTRSDKWYLGGGNRLIWTPPFPVWLDYPGFWDKAHYYNYEFEPVFTWTILDEDGDEIPLRAKGRKWDPSKLTTRYEICDIGYERRTSHITHPISNLRITEKKCCLPNDVLTSVVRINNTSNKKRKLHLIAWTTQPSYPSQKTNWLTDMKHENGSIHFTKHMRHTHHSNTPSLQIACAFGVNRKVSSFSINLSEGSVIQPHWKLTPFYEKFQKGGLPNEIKLTGVNNDGLVYMALHMNVELRAKSEVEVGIFFAAAPIQIEATSSLNNAKRQKNPIKVSESNWEEFFSGVPYFECSDEYLTRYYWYRWYGLRLMMIDGQEGHYKHPAVCEGIGDFRTSISYSAMCHMLETRWMHDPKVAQGSLLNFIENQREDGGFRGYIDVNYYRQEMFYHANWGIALRELYEIHPDDEFLMRVYDGLVKYVEYFDRKRDAEGSGLYDIDNHYETGQEYMHRYIVVNPNADKDNWGEVLQLKGVDVTVYLYELKRTLAWVGEKINRRVPRAHGVRTGAEIAEHRRGAEKIKQAILEKMWDPEEEMFFDIDPASGKRTMVKAATCFYPYMTDIVTEEHLNGLKKHLLNPKEFWTTYPVPSSSVDDEYFSPEAEWKGERMNCPWNGRVWPMTDSHIAEVLAQTAIRFNSKELREKSVEFIAKFIRMMFFDSDPQLPNCYEHYNPNTGKPSVFRGIDDYQHSWIVDLMLKYVAGIRVLENKLMVEPFPFRLRWLLIEDMVINGHRVKIHRQGKNFSVWVDDKHNVPSPGGYGIVTDIS